MLEYPTQLFLRNCSTKSFLDLYLSKFLDISAKLFFPCSYIKKAAYSLAINKRQKTNDKQHKFITKS